MRKTWVHILILTLLLLTGAIAAAAQAADCPAGYVCISPEKARKALVDDDTVKAQVIEIATLKQAVSDEKDVATGLKIELAKTTGELTGAQQTAIQNRAIIDLLLKSVRKKCMPLSLCF